MIRPPVRFRLMDRELSIWLMRCADLADAGDVTGIGLDVCMCDWRAARRQTVAPVSARPMRKFSICAGIHSLFERGEQRNKAPA